MNDDATLLRRYSEERSEDAFTELVRRHVDLVYSAAFRRTGGDPHRAADVAQEVFAKLARKAAGLSRHPVLSAWLYAATRNAAINLMRSEQRRIRREDEAQAMRDLTFGSESDAGWDRLRPALDVVVDQLGEKDRAAVILRFFENRPFAEIGTALNLSENTARMRTERALDKLRILLARRGVTSSSAALAAALSAQAVTAAPAGFTTSLTGAVLAGAAEAGAGSALPQLILAMNKIKVGLAAGLLVAGMATAVVETRANRALSSEIAALQAPVREAPAVAGKPIGKNTDAGELIQLRNRIAQLKARPDGVVDSEMKPRAEWRNVGRATPAAALETLLWGYSVKDMDVIADSFVYAESDQPILDAWFASLNDQVRAKYGTPERLLAPLVANLAANVTDPVAAIQVIDQQNDHAPDKAVITVWTRQASGKEGPWKTSLIEEAGSAKGWRFNPTGRGLTAAEWQSKVFAQINPATGEIVPPSP